jgi:hypothetical protein
VELEWSTQNADHCTLNPGDIRLDANSNPGKPLKVRPKKGQPGYELTAWKGARPSVPRTVLLMPHPFPREFPTPPFPLDLYPMEPIAARYGYDWASAFIGISDWSLAVGRHDSGGHYVEAVAAAVGLKGPMRAMQGIRYLAITTSLKNSIEKFYGIHRLRGNIQGWQGTGWGDVPALHSGGYGWYRVDLNVSGFESNEVFTIDRPSDIFKVWAFKGL